MQMPTSEQLAKTAVFIVAEIKAAIEAFETGESNVFDTLEGIVAALEGHEAATADKPGGRDPRRDAA